MNDIAIITAGDTESRPINELVGMNVGIIAQMRGKTQKELAFAIGVTQGSMSRRIGGTTDWSPDEMKKVADILGVRVARLFEALPDLDDQSMDYGADVLEFPTPQTSYVHHERIAPVTAIGFLA